MPEVPNTPLFCMPTAAAVLRTAALCLLSRHSDQHIIYQNLVNLGFGNFLVNKSRSFTKD